MQTNYLKQPFVIAVIIILAVTVVAVGLNSFTGQASWSNSFRRAPAGIEVQGPLGVDNTGNVYFQSTLGFRLQSVNGKFESIPSFDWTTESINYNGGQTVGVRAGLIKDLYSSVNDRNPRINVKTIKIGAKGASDSGLLIKDSQTGEWFETDTAYLAVEQDGSLGVYRQKQNENDAFLAFKIMPGNTVGDMYIVTDGGSRTRVLFEWGVQAH